MNSLIWLLSIAFPVAPAIVLAVVLSTPFADMGVSPPFNHLFAVFVSLMFETSGAVAGKAYQTRIRREGAWNSGLLFVLVYIVAIIAVVLYADGEIQSKLLVGMLIAFPVVSIGVYTNLASMEQNAEADAIEAGEVEFERQQKIKDAEFAREQKAKDAETRRTIRLHKTAQPIAQPIAQIVHNNNAQQTSLSDAIIAQLNAGALNQSALASEFGVHRNTIGNQLHKLSVKGVVHKNGGGWAIGASKEGK